MKENNESKKIRTYTEEFKNQALALARELGSVRKAADKLGMSANTLHGWTYKRRDQASQGVGNRRASNVAGTAVATPEQVEEENRRLRRENEQLKKANYILKQAAAFFSQDHLK